MPSLSTPNPYASALTIVLRRHLERLQIQNRQLFDPSTPATAFLTKALMKAHLLQLRNTLLKRRCADLEKRHRELTETDDGGHGRPVYSQHPPQQDAPESKAHDPDQANSISEIKQRDERIAELGNGLRSAYTELYVYQVNEDRRVRQILAKEHGEHAKTVAALKNLIFRARCESAIKVTECAELERWAGELENKLVKMAAEQEFEKETYRIRLQQMEGTIKWMGELAQKRALGKTSILISLFNAQAQIRHARVLQQKHESFRQKMIDLLARMKAEKLAPKTNNTVEMEDLMLDATGQQNNSRAKDHIRRRYPLEFNSATSTYGLWYAVCFTGPLTHPSIRPSASPDGKAY